MNRITLIFIILLSAIFVQAQSTISEKKNMYYKKTLVPQGVEYVHNAPITATESIVIDRSIEQVWTIIDDTPNFVNWFPGAISAEFIDPNNIGLGSKRLAHAKNFKYYEDIILYTPNHGWGFTVLESNSGAFSSMVELIRLEKIADNQTRVIYQGGYAPKGILKIMKGVISKNVKKAWLKGLHGLKEYAENN